MSTDEMSNLSAISLSPTQRVLANVATERVEKRTLNKEITAVGVVDFAEPLQTTVSARFRGRIEKLYVNYTGEVVQKGQPLFELYSPDLVSAERDFVLALEGLKSAPASNSMAREQQDQLVKAVRDRLHIHFGMTDEQIAELEKKKDVRNKVIFHSPIQGTVIRKQIAEGQYVDEGMEIYQLADLSRVWIYLDVYEKDIHSVRLGQPVQVSSEAYPDESVTGRVTFIDPVLNSEARTIRVRTEFANSNGKLKPQMYVKAKLSAQVPLGIAVPISAVLSTGKHNLVWVEVQPNMFEPRDVVLGASTDSYYEVLSGLKGGENIVVSGGFLIDSESQLQQPGSTQDHSEHMVQPTKIKKEVTLSSKPATETNQNGTEITGNKDVTDVKIIVKGEYSPDVIYAKQGKKLRLHFYRDEDSECTKEIVFETLSLRRDLPEWKTTTIEFTPKDTGEIEFHCGMDMVRGKIIVGK
jgi:Cu(I)/Ag(I) efflux system membrane fusion protein